MQRNEKLKIYFGASFAGALIGLITAIMLVKNAEQEGRKFSISSNQGLQIGVNALHLFRNILKIAR